MGTPSYVRVYVFFKNTIKYHRMLVLQSKTRTTHNTPARLVVQTSIPKSPILNQNTYAKNLKIV